MSSIDEWTKKIYIYILYTHTYNGILFSHKKKIAIYSNMDRTRGLYIV